MFVLQQEREFWWPVSVDVPADNKHEKKQFRVKLRQMPRQRFAQLLADLQASTDDAASVALLMELVIDWKDVVDASQQAVPFTAETFAALLEIPYVGPALVLAIKHAFTPPAREQRRLGN